MIRDYRKSIYIIGLTSFRDVTRKRLTCTETIHVTRLFNIKNNEKNKTRYMALSTLEIFFGMFVPFLIFIASMGPLEGLFSMFEIYGGYKNAQPLR